MASPDAITNALARLQAIFPRDITPEMAAMYEEALADLTDEELAEAVRRVARTCKFFPVPAEIRNTVSIVTPRIDVESLLRSIEGMGQYNPHVGWIYPRTEEVRARFGDQVAAAYGLAGAARLWSDNETSRDIARQSFTKELDGVDADALTPLLLGVSARKALPA